MPLHDDPRQAAADSAENSTVNAPRNEDAQNGIPVTVEPATSEPDASESAAPAQNNRPVDAPAPAARSGADKPLPRLIVWGGRIGAVVLLALVVLVYFLVIGDERPDSDPLTRTEAAISGEEARLITPSSETAEELERLLSRIEAGGEGDPDALGEPEPAYTHDPFLPPEVVRRMAWWMVEQYYPKGTHPKAVDSAFFDAGISAADVHAVSLFSGPAGESGLPIHHRALDYAFTPDMLEELYRIHAETFTAAFGRALFVARRPARNGETRALTEAERAECIALYANLLTRTGNGLTAYMELPEHSRRLNAWLSARERLATATARQIDARAEHARQTAGDTPEGRQLLQLAVRAREDAVKTEARTRENLLEALRANPLTTGIDSDTLLYIACWAERRITARRENSAAVPTAAELLRRLARDLEALNVQEREGD